LYENMAFMLPIITNRKTSSNMSPSTSNREELSVRSESDSGGGDGSDSASSDEDEESAADTAESQEGGASARSDEEEPPEPPFKSDDGSLSWQDALVCRTGTD
jgi:hypothetical protein